MTFDNNADNNTVQTATNAAASFIETLGRKARSVVSPRTDNNESTFLIASELEGNGNSGRSQRANSIVTGASPFVSGCSLWTASTSLESLNDNLTAAPLMEYSGSASTSSLWDTPRRSSVAAGLSNWKCVGSAASMLQDCTTGRLMTDLLSEDLTEAKITRPRSSTSIVLENQHPTATFAASLSIKTGTDEDEEVQKEESHSRPTSPLEITQGHFMQIPALLHEEIGIESFEEAAEIFKRSSMDSLLDFDPSTLFSSSSLTQKCSSSDLDGSTLMSAVSPNVTNLPADSHFRRHSFNWLDSGAKNYEPSTFFSSIKTIAEVSLPPSRCSSPAPREFPTGDLFPEEFIFAPSASQFSFSKKRFARRHSIAADSLAVLEDSFTQSLSFGNPADAVEFIPGSGTHFSHNAPSYYINSEEYQPISENVFAAYAGLLGEDFIPDQFVSSTSTSSGSEMNTFLSSMRNNTNGISNEINSHCVFNHQVPVSLTPAQAGINPTALSFPNATFHLPTHKGPLHLIEFKSGRTETFFTVDLDTALKVKIGDLVIVEADRGEDFGRITGEIPISRIRQLISQLPSDHTHNHPSHHQNHHSNNDDVYGSNGNVNHNLAGLKETEIAALLSAKEIIPKRIHRHATALDMKFLQAKAHEEAYAMSRCQSRIRQKKLPMEVVDAEYQWDRNKLTFYFSADRRIDFRELVRDLFRIYKTRIWMCAVDKNRANLLNSLESS